MGLVHHVTFKRCKNYFFSARTMAATGSPPSHTVGTIIRHAASLPCVPVAFAGETFSNSTFGGQIILTGYNFSYVEIFLSPTTGLLMWADDQQ